MRQPLEIPVPTREERETLDLVYRTTRKVRLRTRAQIVRLAGEQRLAATDFFVRYNREPYKTRSIIGSNAAKAV